MDDDFGDFDVDDGDGLGDDDDLDNEQDYDVDYDRLLAPVKPPPPPLSREGGQEEGDIVMVAAESFVSTQESASDTVVDYAVDEDEFHKIRLLHCDFLIRMAPDLDDDVFDFREMYVTPPNTDIYSIPRVLAPMPQKYIRCTKKNFGRYHVSEPPVEHLCDPLYKTEREIMKVHGEVQRIIHEYGGKGMPPLSITITGHILGAALAVLTVYEIGTAAMQGEDDAPMVTAVSFSGPRVGNTAFRHRLEGRGGLDAAIDEVVASGGAEGEAVNKPPSVEW